MVRRVRWRKSWASMAWAAVVLVSAVESASAQTSFIWDAGGDGATWSDPGNWFNPTVNDFPRLSSHTALIGGAGAVGGNPPILTSNTAVGDLQIISGGDVFNGLFGNFRFSVVNETLISGNGSSLRLNNSPSSEELVTDILTINGTGTSDAGLVLTDSIAQVNGEARIDSGGAISGSGTLRLNSTTGSIVNDGTILVPEDQTLRIAGTTGNTRFFDWDGSAGNTAVLDVRTDATLDIDLSQNNDAFGGRMIVGFFADVDNAFPWTLDTGGTIEFRGGSTGAPGDIRGAAVVSRGTIDAEFGSGAFFNDNVDFQTGTITVGSTGGAFSQLSLRNGNIRNAVNTQLNNGNLIVIGDFTIDQAGKLLDLDGAFNDNGISVGGGASLSITAATINPNTGSFTTNRFAGDISLSGRLDLNIDGPDLLLAKLDPTDDPRFFMFGRNDSVPTFGGAAIVFGGDSSFRALKFSSAINPTGRFEESVRFDGGSIEIEDGMTVIFEDRAAFRGSPTSTGTGTMRFEDQVIFSVSAVTLPFGTEFAAGSNVTMTTDSVLLDGPVTFSGSTINGNNAFVINDSLEVDSGTTTVRTRSFILDGASAFLPPSSTIIRDGARLIVDVDQIDPGGPAVTSLVNNFEGTLDVAGEFRLDTFSQRWQNTGTISLNNGRIAGGARLINQAQLNAAGDSSIRSLQTDPAGTNNINGTLRVDRLDLRGGAFTGIGSLVVEGLGFIDDNQSTGSVALVNEGDLGWFGTLGRLNTASYEQTAAGRLTVEIAGDGGVGGVDFDQIAVTGTAEVAGLLTVNPSPGFTYSQGDLYTILTAGGGVTGRFDDAALPSLAQGDLLSIMYTANAVVLEVIAGLQGDYNGDGFVSQPDLDLVLLNWGRDANTAGVPTGWVNDLPVGIISQRELDGVLLNWGDGTPPSVNAIPEPISAAWLGPAAVWAGLGRRRLRRDRPR